MKLLLDASLSWRLCARLKEHFQDCFHVDRIGLKVPATDTLIWLYALHNKLVIVTNDIDFLNLLDFKGFPPKIILLKTGNQSNKHLEALLIKHKEKIAAFSKDNETGLLEIF
jgi:predicted nuclease of predicted toxin-antitoxin system